MIMHIKPRLVLLDSDVVITLHRVGAWSGILSNYDVWMTETMVKQEVLFYNNSEGCRIPIDLNEDVDEGRLVVHSVATEGVLEVLNKFDAPMRSALHLGEVEALSVIHSKRETNNLHLCTGDGKAIEALVLLGLKNRGVSLESLLLKVGLSKRIPSHFSEDRFRQLVEKASADRIQGIGIQ